MAIALAMVGAVAVSFHIRILPYAWFMITSLIDPPVVSDEAIDLARYRTDTPHGMVIDGIEGNLSGLTWVAGSDTLFAAINDPPEVVELATSGDLLRRMPVVGARDVEGITHVAGDRFVLADEGTQTLHWVEIAPDAQVIDLAEAPRLHLGIDAVRNMGFEGLSWDSVDQRLVIVQEMLPLRVLEVSGIEEALAGARLDISVRDLQSRNGARLFMRDLSSVTLHEKTGHLLLLSEMSAMLVEYDRQGKAIGVLDLELGGAGFERTVPQAEGVAMGKDGEIYIVSEPNLLFRLVRDKPAIWAQNTDVALP
ncbi:MAG: SdiA-regulated domain-containing protein [Pseudorhodobacter sp.]